MKTRTIFFLSLFLLGLLTACGAEQSAGPTGYTEKIASDTFITGDVARGDALFAARVVGSQNAPGCIGCHVAEADVNIVGPSQIGMVTLAEEALNAPDYEGNAQSVEGYLWESVVYPEAHLIDGYANIMYADYDDKLTEQEIADLVAYMLTLN